MFDLSGEAVHLDRALERYEEAVSERQTTIQELELCQGGSIVQDPEGLLVELFYQLGLNYLERNKRTMVVSDLARAIQRFQDAVAELPQDDAERWDTLYQLGAAYYRRFGQTRSSTDIAAAGDIFSGLLRSMPEDHPSHTRAVWHLATCYEKQHSIASTPGSIADAIQRLQEISKLSTVHSYLRISVSGALAWLLNQKARQSNQMEDMEASLQAFQDYIDMLSSALPACTECLDTSTECCFHQDRPRGRKQDVI